MLRTASSIPLSQSCYTGLRPAVCRPDRQPTTGPPGSFPDRTSPAIDDKLTNSEIRCYVTASLSALLGARNMDANVLTLPACR